jgi:hypothetical protein
MLRRAYGNRNKRTNPINYCTNGGKRFLSVEKCFWSYHSPKPVERFIELPKPNTRVRMLVEDLGQVDVRIRCAQQSVLRTSETRSLWEEGWQTIPGSCRRGRFAAFASGRDLGM